MAELIREGVDRLLEGDDRRLRWRRFLASVDRFDGSGRHDVARDHAATAFAFDRDFARHGFAAVP